MINSPPVGGEFFLEMIKSPPAGCDFFGNDKFTSGPAGGDFFWK